MRHRMINFGLFIILLIGIVGVVCITFELKIIGVENNLNSMCYSSVKEDDLISENGNSTKFDELIYELDNQNINNSNLTKNHTRTETIIKIIFPPVEDSFSNNNDKLFIGDIYAGNYDLKSGNFMMPGLVFSFQVFMLENGSIHSPIGNNYVKLIINSTYSVFSNYTVKKTDSYGFVRFIFNSTLTDTYWGYTLARTDPEELEINAKYLGDEDHKPSEITPIYATHWPYYERSEPPPPEPPGYCFSSFSLLIPIFIGFLLYHEKNK